MNMSTDSNETTTSSSNELAIQFRICPIGEYQLDYGKLIKPVAEFRANIERFDVISKQATNYYNYYLAKSIAMKLASRKERAISFTELFEYDAGLIQSEDPELKIASICLRIFENRDRLINVKFDSDFLISIFYWLQLIEGSDQFQDQNPFATGQKGNIEIQPVPAGIMNLPFSVNLKSSIKELDDYLADESEEPIIQALIAYLYLTIVSLNPEHKINNVGISLFCQLFVYVKTGVLYPFSNIRHNAIRFDHVVKPDKTNYIIEAIGPVLQDIDDLFDKQDLQELLFKNIKSHFKDKKQEKGAKIIDHIFAHPVFTLNDILNFCDIPKPTAFRFISILKEKKLVVTLRKPESNKSEILGLSLYFKHYINPSLTPTVVTNE